MRINRMERRGWWKLMPILVGAALPALSACDAMKPNVYEPRREYVRVQPPTLDSVRAAPETIDVGELRIAARAHLSINLMPGPSIDRPAAVPGTPLVGRIHIHPADSAVVRPLPAGLEVVGAWLRSGDSIWPFRFRLGDTTRVTSMQMLHDVRTGPPWLHRDSSVDVVVRLRRRGGPPVLLRVPRVPVDSAH